LQKTLLNKKEEQANYACCAQNIKVESLECFFEKPVKKKDVHGDNKSVMSPYGEVTFHSKTMLTKDGKYKVWVFRGDGEKNIQDAFEVKIPTSEELLRVMLERATGLDAQGNKVEIAA
jgi:hypothetical protein